MLNDLAGKRFSQVIRLARSVLSVAVAELFHPYAAPGVVAATGIDNDHLAVGLGMPMDKI